jgi:hypothetical protein
MDKLKKKGDIQCPREPQVFRATCLFTLRGRTEAVY